MLCLIVQKQGRNMTLATIFIIIVALGSVIAGILLLKQSAGKFKLSEEQQQKIKAREAEQVKKDQEQK